MSRINIMLGNEAVGSIGFTQPEIELAAARTASGFRVQVPAIVTFTPPSGSGAPLLLENLRVTFSASGSDGQQVEIGVASYSMPLRTTVRDRSVTLSWDWTLPAFAFYERIRYGNEPRFRLSVSGEIRYVLPGEPGREPCSIASPFHERCEVGYSRPMWTAMLRQLNLRDSILVEIPFPSDPPSGWESVWQALLDARASFDAGGTTGWKNCVGSLRHALEEWQRIEKEDQGPGWERPSTADLQSRTKAQRIDNLRWHLLQCAHLAPHTKADDWTREDALLILSTLCSLLDGRKP